MKTQYLRQSSGKLDKARAWLALRAAKLPVGRSTCKEY
jgi:hypothetical protein